MNNIYKLVVIDIIKNDFINSINNEEYLIMNQKLVTILIKK